MYDLIAAPFVDFEFIAALPSICKIVYRSFQGESSCIYAFPALNIRKNQLKVAQMNANPNYIAANRPRKYPTIFSESYNH